MRLEAKVIDARTAQWSPVGPVILRLCNSVLLLMFSVNRF